MERYGEAATDRWIVEVWNEPNGGFWAGDQQDYFALYAVASKALKAAAPGLLVGGPGD